MGIGALKHGLDALHTLIGIDVVALPIDGHLVLCNQYR